MEKQKTPVPGDIGKIIKAARKYSKTDWEVGFVDGQAARFEKFGMELYLSDKQLDILRKIAGMPAPSTEVDERESEEGGHHE